VKVRLKCSVVVEGRKRKEVEREGEVTDLGCVQDSTTYVLDYVQKTG
jgi:hypothetical protein